MNWLKTLISFFKLIRWSNLLIITLVQYALYYVLVEKVYSLAGINGALGFGNLTLLVAITVLIAAAGYIINDYMDVDTDKVNKPDKMIIGNGITMKAGLFIYRTMNFVAAVIGFYLAWKVGSWRLGTLFPMIMILLWLYSARYKSSVLWGNISVALMAALVILFVWLFEFFMLRKTPEIFISVAPFLRMISAYFVFYASFAFLLTMLREVVKDAEDINGDTVTGFMTLAVVRGITVSRKVAVGICSLTLLAVGIAVYIFFTGSMNVAAFYFIIAVGGPLVYILIKVISATEKEDFHLLSNLVKIVMLAGLIGLQPIAMSLN